MVEREQGLATVVSGLDEKALPRFVRKRWRQTLDRPPPVDGNFRGRLDGGIRLATRRNGFGAVIVNDIRSAMEAELIAGIDVVTIHTSAHRRLTGRRTGRRCDDGASKADLLVGERPMTWRTVMDVLTDEFGYRSLVLALRAEPHKFSGLHCHCLWILSSLVATEWPSPARRWARRWRSPRRGIPAMNTSPESSSNMMSSARSSGADGRSKARKRSSPSGVRQTSR